MTKWTTWTPCGPSSRAALCARPAARTSPWRRRRRAAKPFTLAVGAGQQDRAVLLGDHAPGGLLHHQEAAEGRDLHRAAHLERVDVDDPAADPGAGIVDHQIRREPIFASASSNSRATASGSAASAAKVAAPISAARDGAAYRRCARPEPLSGRPTCSARASEALMPGPRRRSGRWNRGYRPCRRAPGRLQCHLVAFGNGPSSGSEIDSKTEPV